MAKPLQTSRPASKRKSTDEQAKDAKRPRITLDAFFSPKVSVRMGAGIDGIAGGVQEKIHDVVLSEEQRKVLKMVVDERKSVFFTGSAGTGKSLLLKAIIASLKKKHAKTPEIVSVTASTGMAASNIGGMTIHSWGAVAPTVESVDKLISYIRKARPALQRWKTTQVLVIDEVSMVDGHLFDRLVAIATRLRKKTDKPFGGIQLVVTGDFFQLPPVTKGKEEPFFAFESNAWKECIQHTVTLTQVFRQKDNRFVELLNQLRHGKITPDAVAAFHGLSRPIPPSPTLTLPPTELFPMRHEVDRANSTRLASLSAPPRTYAARDSGSAQPERRQTVLASMIVPGALVLKLGAQVMLVKNIDDQRGLVNGAVGRVLGFFAAPKGREGVIKDVRLAEDGKSVEFGVPGVEGKENVKPVSGLGRVKPESDKVKEKASAGEPVKGEMSEEQFPLVEFLTPMGKETALVTRDEFRVEDSEGTVLARRVQVPLILAWAISIHKSQGQTIQRVRIDLGKVFEKGQSYVALSRAASMEGLQVLRFDPRKVVAHPKVVEWSKTLTSCQAQDAGLGTSAGPSVPS